MNKLKPTPRLQATIRNDGDAGAIFEIYSCRELTGQGIEGEIALFVISRRTAKDFVEAAALLSYYFSLTELRRRAAAYIDKILRGAKPADLPIEQPTQFELGINLRTAKAFGIAVPHTLISRADEVIQ